MTPHQLLGRIRIWLVLFVICLVLSGVTAFPLFTEVHWLSGVLHDYNAPQFAVDWIDRVLRALQTADPLLSYGTDWLAFAHIVIGLAFIGPYKDPVRNIWVIHWAMLCCVAIIPTVLIAAPIREIPFWWQLIDMSFGVFGLIPLWIVHRLIRRYEAALAPGDAVLVNPGK